MIPFSTSSNDAESVSEWIGLGSINARFLVYFPHHPQADTVSSLNSMRLATPGELEHIVSQTGNHWRKIFNIAAKLAFALDERNHATATWQQYRDRCLCQEGSPVGLIFQAKTLASSNNSVHIISGHQYCSELYECAKLTSIDPDFNCDRLAKVIDSPYFDYRQLSNVKLDRLIKLCRELRF